MVAEHIHKDRVGLRALTNRPSGRCFIDTAHCQFAGGGAGFAVTGDHINIPNKVIASPQAFAHASPTGGTLLNRNNAADDNRPCDRNVWYDEYFCDGGFGGGGAACGLTGGGGGYLGGDGQYGIVPGDGHFGGRGSSYNDDPCGVTNVGSRDAGCCTITKISSTV